jgi:hypothetical protein
MRIMIRILTLISSNTFPRLKPPSFVEKISKYRKVLKTGETDMHDVSDFPQVESQAEAVELDVSESALRIDSEDGFQFIFEIIRRPQFGVRIEWYVS